jgi:protein-disulfide isomerase
MPDLSIKQQRELKRQSKMAEQGSATDARRRRRLTAWVSSVVAILIIVGGLWWAAQPNTNSNGSGQATPGLQANDHVRGNLTSSVVLIEYSDFQCPACKSYEPILSSVYDAYKDKVAFVYRSYPLTQIHEHARAAALAAEAADKQGQFWAYHQLLFDRQNSWSQTTDEQGTFTAYAKELGLNTDQFVSDMQSTAVADRLKQQIDFGNSSNVNGTPTFFLDGKLIQNPRTEQELQQELDTALAAAPTSNTNSLTN